MGYRQRQFLNPRMKRVVRYYVDATNGNDSNSGRSPSMPLQTRAGINAIALSPGNHVQLKRDEVWPWASGDPIKPTISGTASKPIEYGAYGTGADPVLSNGAILTGWTQYTGTTWQKDDWYSGSQLFMDDVRLTEGSDKDTLNDHEWISEGSAPAIIYFRDDSGDPDITGVVMEVSRDFTCIDTNEQSYLTFQDIKLAKSNGPTVWAPSVGSHLIFRRIESDRGLQGIWVGYNSAGAMTNVSIDRCMGNCVHIVECDDSAITGCLLTGVGHEAFIQELIQVLNGPDRVRVEGNWVSHCNGRGIWFQPAGDDCIARNNIVHDIGENPSGWGMGIDFDGYESNEISGALVEGNRIYNIFDIGINMENTTLDAIVRNNIIYATGDAAISIINYAEHKGTNCSGLIYNNLVYECQKAMSIFNTAGWDIWHNTFADCTDNGALLWPDIGFPEYVADISFKNNAVHTASQLLAFREDYWDLLDDHDYNIYYGVDKFVVTNPYAEETLAQFQTETGQEANSDYADPLFVDDYHIGAGSPCIGAGINVGIALDLDGVPRTDPPDIGAYQNVPVP